MAMAFHETVPNKSNIAVSSGLYIMSDRQFEGGTASF